MSQSLVGDAMRGLLEKVLTFLRSVLKRILATPSSHVLLWPTWKLEAAESLIASRKVQPHCSISGPGRELHGCIVTGTYMYDRGEPLLGCPRTRQPHRSVSCAAAPLICDPSDSFDLGLFVTAVLRKK